VALATRCTPISIEHAPTLRDVAVRRNLIANLIGTGWAMLLQLAFTPVWLSLLGSEAYGLIGIHLLAIGLCSALDAGLTPAINREAARLLADGDPQRLLGAVARTANVCLAAIGLGAALLVAGASHGIAHRWLDLSTLLPAQVQACITMTGWTVGMLIAANAPIALLQGMESQVRLNVVRIACATAANVGALLLIQGGYAGVEGWFACQLIAAGTQYALLLVLALGVVPRWGWSAARIELAALRPLARFALDMGLVAVVGVALVQIDRLILSRLVDLTTFGWYTLATVTAGGLRALAMPVFSALYPRMTSCLQRGDQAALVRLHRQSTWALAVLVVPPAALLVLAPNELLALWTQRPEVATAAAPILRLLAIGALANAFMHIPYAVQLGAGWTRLSLVVSLVSIVVMVPAVVIGASRWGAVGAACAWPALGLAIMVVVVPLVHRRYRLGSGWAWLAQVLAVTALGMAAFMGVHALVSEVAPGAGPLVGLVLAGAASFVTLATMYSWQLRRERQVAREQGPS
jgi:O-antigen/teichoic acid export membrane protein